MAILCVHVSEVVLSTRTRDFGCVRYCSLEVCVVSSTTLHEKMIVAHSRQLMEMRSGDFFFINLMVRRTTSGGHFTQYQNLSSGQKAPQPVRHASPATI